MKNPRTWYVVMNSHRARILRNLPNPQEALPVEISLEGRRRKMTDVIQDRPTRSFASAGGGRRSAVEPGSNPLQEDARVFMHELQEFLTKEATAEAFDRLVVVAPSDAMGIWRTHIPEELKDRIHQEIIRNLVLFPGRELVAALRALVQS